MSTSCGWEGKGRYGSFRLRMNVWACAGKTVKSLENTYHTWAFLRWWFTMKRRYIKFKCMHLYHFFSVRQKPKVIFTLFWKFYWNPDPIQSLNLARGVARVPSYHIPSVPLPFIDVSYALLTTMIRLRFDRRSTPYSTAVQPRYDHSTTCGNSSHAPS